MHHHETGQRRSWRQHYHCPISCVLSSGGDMTLFVWGPNSWLIDADWGPRVSREDPVFLFRKESRTRGRWSHPGLSNRIEGDDDRGGPRCLRRACTVPYEE